jgi:hypothetical protein
MALSQAVAGPEMTGVSVLLMVMACVSFPVQPLPSVTATL